MRDLRPTFSVLVILGLMGLGPLPAAAEVQATLETKFRAAAPETHMPNNFQFGEAAALDGDTLVVSAAPGTLDDGAVYVFEPEPLTGFWTVVAKLIPSNRPPNQDFGVHVAVEAGVVVVGARNSRAYVYVEPAGGWVGTLTEDAQLASQLLSAMGGSVSISGGTIAATSNNTGTPNVYLFQEPPGGWSGTVVETAILTKAGGGANFEQVAISGDTVVAADIVSLGQFGTAHVWIEPAGGWTGTQTETAILSPSDPAFFDFFGHRLAVEGDVIVAATSGQSDPTGRQAYIYVKPAGGWVNATEDVRLVGPDPATAGGFAPGFALQGDELFVGNAFGPTTYIYREPAGGWQGTPLPVATLEPEDPSFVGLFGISVAVSGERVVVGDSFGTVADAPAGQLFGAAYVFERPAGGWPGLLTEEQKLIAAVPDFDFAQFFGTSTAFDGNLAVVGANGDDTLASNAGAAYVFERRESGWVLMAKLLASDGAQSDGLGNEVALSGDTIAVAAGKAGLDNTGAVYVWTKPPEGWVALGSEDAKLVASDAAAEDEFGARIAMDGDTIVVGADVDAGNPGKAYVFVEPGGGWSGTLTETARLTPSDSAPDDSFGAAVGISADVAVATSGLGGYVFAEPVGGWTGTLSETAKLVSSDFDGGDIFGVSAAIDGDAVVIGAALDDLPGVVDAGSAYVFTEPVSGWSGTLAESAKLTAATPTTGALFGATVAAAEGAVAVGRDGAFSVFVEPAGGWSGALQEEFEVAPPDAIPGDFFGVAVALTGRGVLAGSLNAFKGVSLAGAAYEFGLSTDWAFNGVAQGGSIAFALGGVAFVVNTFSGESASAVATNIAAAINADPTLAAASIFASVDGNVVATNAVVSATVVNDPGLEHLTKVPALAPTGLALLAFCVGALGLRSARSAMSSRE